MSFKPKANFRLGVSPATLNDEVVRIYQSISTVWNEIVSLRDRVGTWSKEGLIYAKENDLLASTTRILTDGSKLTRYGDFPLEGLGVPVVLDYVLGTGIAAAVTTTSLANSTDTGVYRVSAHLWGASDSTHAVYALNLLTPVTKGLCSIDTADTGDPAGHDSETYFLYTGGPIQFEITKTGGDSGDTASYAIVLERLG